MIRITDSHLVFKSPIASFFPGTCHYFEFGFQESYHWYSSLDFVWLLKVLEHVE